VTFLETVKELSDIDNKKNKNGEAFFENVFLAACIYFKGLD